MHICLFHRYDVLNRMAAIVCINSDYLNIRAVNEQSFIGLSCKWRLSSFIAVSSIYVSEMIYRLAIVTSRKIVSTTLRMAVKQQDDAEHQTSTRTELHHVKKC